MADTYILPNKQLAAALLSPVRTVMTVFLSLVILLLMFWCVCVTMYYGSWNRDIAPLRELFNAALLSISPGEPMGHVAPLAEQLTGRLHQTLFVSTGVEAMQHTPPSRPTDFNRALDFVAERITPAFHVVIAATQVFGVRLAILLGMLPLVALIYAVARIDGHAERLIRRACAGRESASLYHRAKYMQYGLLGMLLIALLCLPIALNPSISMLVFVIALAVLARVQGAYYKKYL